ncbi:SdiA-regulated domain-containing protein [Endozoicomonas ascidiicola]|uniref:SdiA-regulated domain-containing protein n=1 Tax=Endozoicomonas ascidiicola TaxID=1698521 RepID=UPI000833EA25|nr:SdiA-regulated domain-containing protein [Endozoicomonas ascidiicola]
MASLGLKTLPFKKYWIALSSLVLIISTIKILGADDVFRAWHINETTSESVKERSIWLPSYFIATEPKTLDGITDNASGITWSPITNSLFIVINGQNEVFELTLDGDIVRRIPLKNFRDVEAITWVGDDQFIVADERDQSLVKLTITPETSKLNKQDFPSFTMGVESGDNKGFEGVAWDPTDNAIFVVRERDPMRLYKVYGLVSDGSPSQVSIKKSKALSKAAKKRNNDLSGLHFDHNSGNLLVLSHESNLVSEINARGDNISFLELGKGWHGLDNTVPQAEGITMDDNGNLYVISEPNLFYKFSRNTET